MDAPYQARDDIIVVWAGLGGDSIFGIMPRKTVEVKRSRFQCAVVGRSKSFQESDASGFDLESPNLERGWGFLFCLTNS